MGHITPIPFLFPSLAPQKEGLELSGLLKAYARAYFILTINKTFVTFKVSRPKQLDDNMLDIRRNDFRR